MFRSYPRGNEGGVLSEAGFSGWGGFSGWVGLWMEVVVRIGIWGDFRVPDNRMALDCPYNCHMKTLVPVMLTAVAVLACSGEREPQPTAPDQFAPDQAATIVLAPAFGGLTFDRPVALAFPGDDASRALVVEQPGRILLLTKKAETWSATEFLDITARVNDRGNEEGLLGLALDPDFESNGLFYVYYTASSPRRSVASRFTVTDDDLDLADAGSESIIIEVSQPYPITTEARYSSDRMACCTSDWATEAAREIQRETGRTSALCWGRYSGSTSRRVEPKSATPSRPITLLSESRGASRDMGLRPSESVEVHVRPSVRRSVGRGRRTELPRGG